MRRGLIALGVFTLDTYIVNTAILTRHLQYRVDCSYTTLPKISTIDRISFLMVFMPYEAFSRSHW